MSNLLKKKYVQKKIQNENLLYEGILDMFDSNSENTQKVKNALAHTKKIASTFGLKNIQNAVSRVEANFEGAIASNNMKNKGVALSNIVTFSDIMSDFFRELDETVMSLPSVESALATASSPENSQKTIGELVSEQGDKVSPIIGLTKIIEDQFQESAGGFLKGIGRFFKTGNITTSQQALQYAGLNSQQAAQDILGVVASKYKEIINAGKQVPVVQISAPNPASNPESGSTKSVQSTATQGTQTTTPTKTADPTQSSNATTGNSQFVQKPTPVDAQKREIGLQGSLKNRTAFNPKILGQLSNEEIKSDLINIAKTLGINLK